ncbi:hypothetical protein [Vibrio europaeus]|uniref:hypothetical protein n=1 Tax=Vibrio europaeus TaxID=300876 RepID=UPI00233F2EDD|nr:hypothetical protein [Vibrio europaeus]MDC5857428.1 hypothetical protein [Vibrio europaeus]
MVRNRVAHALALIFGSSWVGVTVYNRVFDAVWLLVITFFIGFVVGLVIHKKDKSHPYFGPRDDRSFIQKQNPVLYGCFTIIIMGLVTLYSPAYESFQIMTHIADKRESHGKGGTSYVLDLGHTTYGTISITVSEQVWQNQRVGKSIWVDVEENVFGQVIFIEHEPL